MKLLSRFLLTTLAASALLASSHAETFDVFKASATLSGFVTGVNDEGRNILIPYKLNTKQLINLARGRALKDKVPPNEILAGAGDATSMASFDLGVVASAQQALIVYDKVSLTVLATILVTNPATVEVAENRIFTKFRRIGFAESEVKPTGDATNGLTSGVLRGMATLTRKPGAEPPVPKQLSTANGVVELVDAGTAKTFFVTKGVINVSGKRLGQFDD